MGAAARTRVSVKRRLFQESADSVCAEHGPQGSGPTPTSGRFSRRVVAVVNKAARRAGCARSRGVNVGGMVAAASDPLIGVEIGRYRLTSVIGEGGMGRVYLGVHPGIGSRVAVKVLSDACTQRPELLERFFAEARAVNLIRHENIVSVIDMAVLPTGQPYIVMELVEGRTLGALVRGVAAPLGGVVAVVSEVLAALAAAHAIGIVHRDLKPDNVMITAEGHAKVLDFGIAKLAPGLGNNHSPRTATGALLGTPAYMAPEQISGAEHVDARTDLYAAGVVLYECVTGRPPFVADTVFDLMRMHVDVAPRPPRALRSDLPPALEQVILMALEKDPARRFQSAGAMIAALAHAGAELPAHEWQALSGAGRQLSMSRLASAPRSGLAATAPSIAPAARPSRWPLGLGLGLGLTALAALGIVLVIRGRGATQRAESGAPGNEYPGHVTVGPNVTAGGVPLVPSVPSAPAAHGAPSVPAGFDPKHFDAMAFLPRALELARAEYGDAGLTRLDTDGVHADGIVDLTLPGTDGVLYYFRSPSRSERPADLPPNIDVSIECYVTVAVTAADGVVVARRSMSPIDSSCRWAVRPPPACKPADVWARARADGADPGTVAKVEFLSDGKWFFDNEYDGTGLVKTYDDTCK